MFHAPKAPDSARYDLEHQVLPGLILRENGSVILDRLSACPGAFFVDLYKTMHEGDAGYVCPYAPDDFAVQTSGSVNDEGDTVLVCRVTMPEPEMPPLCHEIILLSDKAHRSIRYLTAEKTMDGPLPILCERRSNGMHGYIGPCSDEKLQRVISHTRFGKTE